MDHSPQTPNDQESSGSQAPDQPPIEVPASALSDEALEGLIEEFIGREGTDYGWVEASHDAKTKAVRRQIQAGEVKIVFDPNTESVTLMTKQQWSRRPTASAQSGDNE